MPLNANRTSADFTFKHTGQVDEYGASVGDIAVVQGNFDSRAIDNLNDINNIKNTMKSVSDSDSGADNIGATAITGLGAANTIQGILEALASLGIGVLPGDNTLTEAKMVSAMKKQSGGVAEYDTVATHLADNATAHTPENPIAPTLINSWVNYGAGYSTAKYWKDTMGIVHCAGLIRSGTLAQPAFVLPVGYRPLLGAGFATQANDAFSYIRVGSNGDVVVQVGNTANVSLDAISFRAGV